MGVRFSSAPPFKRKNMKLKFVVPGEQLKMLEDVKFVDTGWNKMNIDVIPKDTILQISQVYIRNKDGYYQSSLSFKFVSGPGYEKFLKSENDKKLAELQEDYSKLKEQFEDLEKHDADWEFTNHQSWDERKPTYHKGTIDDYRKFMDKHYGSFSYHKSTYEEMAKKALEKVNKFKPKDKISSNFCRVFRVPLAEIEKWEVELLPGRVVDESELYVRDDTPPRPLEEIMNDQRSNFVKVQSQSISDITREMSDFFEGK